MKRMNKGTRVKTSGKGRTARWRTIAGTVTKRRRSSVFVRWDGTSFEDQMDASEVVPA